MSSPLAPPAAPDAGAPEAPSLRRDWALFTALTFLFGFGFAVYAGVFQNFLREELHAGPLRMGGLESLTAITAGTLVALAESRVGVLGLVITAVGIGVTGSVPGFWLLVAVTMFWSI